DWMERNFFRRFEVCFPILDEALRSRVLAEALELPLLDNQQAWELASDGGYAHAPLGRKQPLKSQQALLDHHAERLSAAAGTAKKESARKKRGVMRATDAPERRSRLA